MNSWRKVGIASRAGAPSERRRWAMSRQPRTLQALGFDDFFSSASHASAASRRTAAGKAMPVAYEPRLAVELADGPQEPVRNLDHDARAVAAVLLGAGSTAVLRLTSAVMALSTMSRLRRPWMSTTMARHTRRVRGRGCRARHCWA